MRTLWAIAAALCVAGPVWADPLAAETSSVATSKRPFSLALGVQFRSLAVFDEDPRNDTAFVYRGEMSWPVSEATRMFLRVGVLHQLVQVGSLPAIRFQDMLIGARYNRELRLGDEQVVELQVGLGMYLPTSIASQRQTLFGAPELVVSGSWSPVPWAGLDVGTLGRYLFVHYAERDGVGGRESGAPMNNQLVLGGSLDAWVQPYADGDTRLVLGVGASTTLRKRYAAADDFVSEASDTVYWEQLYGWEGYARWTIVEWLTATLAIEQGAGVLRDGIVNVNLTKLEETELVVGFTARL
jgi:hypothetical protein